MLLTMLSLQASLQCSILGSSIALLSGQKPAFRLLARAISLATGQPVPHIKPAVSEAFVVATPRVKSAQKVLHPCYPSRRGSQLMAGFSAPYYPVCAETCTEHDMSS